MTKRVLSVGQCGPDDATLARYLNKHFAVDIVRAVDQAETIATLHEQPADLVLINRKLDVDYSDGSAILIAIKSDPALKSVPVMIVSNHPETHAEAEQLGGVRGFGKLEYDKPETRETLARYLESK